MPKLLTRASNSHRYSAPMPVPISNNTMSYYTTAARGQPTMTAAYYDAMPTTAAQAAPMSMAYHEPYAVTPLTIPGSSSVSATGLPTQHRASSGAWNPSDDQTLLQARAQGQNWAQIQQNFFPNKTPNACRKRHERLMERKGADDWDTRKMERMAREYMSLRKEIWAPLAQRTGEKWSVVEQKCMSSGIKNLQAHARAFARRERLESGQPLAYDDDSGIDGIGLTPVDDMEGGAYSSPEGSTSGTTAASGSSGGHTYSMAPMHAAQGYYAGHSYTSSVSSMGGGGHAVAGPSSGGSPYMGPHGNRLPSVDAMINRSRGGGEMM